MNKPVILTGLRSNNDLHIGNYFGALLPIVDMATQKADDYQINLFVPDLHSITTPVDYDQLQRQTSDNLKYFIAAGLPIDHPAVYIYRQSYVPAHSELTWIINCFTGVGEMNRMTQFKDKSTGLNDKRISVGLFNYPVLMAADILLYGATYVPVGEDQTQHLEFARDTAERFNNLFGQIFVVPSPVSNQHKFFGRDQGLRIRDLTDPTKKMSKSNASSKGVIFLKDSPEIIKDKIMSATTDGYNRIHFNFSEQPGISNLLQIMALIAKKPLTLVSNDWEGKSNYGLLKTEVADLIINFITSLHSKLAMVDEGKIQTKLTHSETIMNQQANLTLLKVQQAVGLRPRPTRS